MHGPMKRIAILMPLKLRSEKLRWVFTWELPQRLIRRDICIGFGIMEDSWGCFVDRKTTSQ